MHGLLSHTLVLIVSCAMLMCAMLFCEEPPQAPTGLPPIPWPKNNPYTKQKAELGRLLYFDKRLSTDGTVSCASCHQVGAAFADHKNVSQGIHGFSGSRNAPTIINAAYQTHYFWDGRALSLEEQAKGPIGNPREMTAFDTINKAYLECHKQVKAIPGYCQLFKSAFGTDECSIDQIVQAIATFERTVVSGNSPYDRYLAGDRTAMSLEAIQGEQVFKRAGCANCHFGFNFSDGRFLNIGVGMDAKNPDLGRYLVTKNPQDRGAFKIPTLREVSKSYPYMHDGSLKTLEEVIDYYDKGGTPNPNLSPLMKPLHLSAEDKKALKSFLEALCGEGWQHFSAPDKFP